MACRPYPLAELFSLFDGADAHAVPIRFAEHVANALTLSSDALSGDVVLLNEDFLHSLGTFLGNASVDFCATFGRSITLDVDGGIFVVLEESGHALHVGQLCSIHRALALAECNGLFERLSAIRDNFLLYHRLTVAAVV